MNIPSNGANSEISNFRKKILTLGAIATTVLPFGCDRGQGSSATPTPNTASKPAASSTASPGTALATPNPTKQPSGRESDFEEEVGRYERKLAELRKVNETLDQQVKKASNEFKKAHEWSLLTSIYRVHDDIYEHLERVQSMPKVKAMLHKRINNHLSQLESVSYSSIFDSESAEVFKVSRECLLDSHRLLKRLGQEGVSTADLKNKIGKNHNLIKLNIQKLGKEYFGKTDVELEDYNITK